MGCHLIIGDAVRPLPSEIYSHKEKEKKITKDLKERWKDRKQVSNHHWNLWREEYLTTLRKLTKYYCPKRDIKEGDVVLDLLDRKNKLEWPIRIVHEALKARAPGEKEPRVREKREERREKREERREKREERREKREKRREKGEERREKREERREKRAH